MQTTRVISRAVAETHYATRYLPLTHPYTLPTQRWMLESARATLDRDQIDYILVGNQHAIEIWRTRKGTDPFGSHKRRDA